MNDVYLRYGGLLKALYSTNDPLSFILRGHLYCEVAITRLLERKLPNPDALNLDRMMFYQKLKLAEATHAVPVYLVEGLTKLNALRNKYAHRLDYAATDEDQAAVLAAVRHGLQEPLSSLLPDNLTFPIGLKRAILLLWFSLELSLAPDFETGSEMILASISMIAQVALIEDPERTERLRQGLVSLVTRAVGALRAAAKPKTD